MRNKVIILGGGINALGIIRSFQKTDIPVITMSWYKDYGMSSRFTRSLICPNPLDKNALIDFLVDFGSQQHEKSVLFATSDLFLLAVIEEKAKLSEYYHIPVADWNILSQLLKKEHLYKLAETYKIPAPKTSVAFNFNEFKALVSTFDLPIIIKPSVNITFTKHFGEKALQIQSNADLLSVNQKMEHFAIEQEPIIIQDFIPGDIESLYTITSYANQSSEILGYSIGHKIRQYPPETGTIISGKIKHVPEILEAAKRFVEKTGFYGISNIEFKKDSRDNQYKLMEINPRTGVWNYSALACGVNLPLLTYQDILDLPFTPQANEKKTLVWLISPLDFYYSIKGYKSKGYSDYSISLNQWRKSIKGKKVDACFQWNDPMPFIKGLLMKFR